MTSSDKASILFVHGAGHGAWCWRDNFTSWFEMRGYRAAAIDLPGHGELDRKGLKSIPLATYVSCVATAARQLSRPLILIGHSMGGFIVQKYLEASEVDLAVLLASVPPRGAMGMVQRMATRRPRSFLHTVMTGEGTDSARRTRDYFFSPETPEEVVQETHRRLQSESMRVLRDMMVPLHPERVTSPVVAMGARHDWLVAPPRELEATARAFKTEPITMPGGHDMMLDVAWERVALMIETSIAAQATKQPRAPVESPSPLRDS